MKEKEPSPFPLKRQLVNRSGYNIVFSGGLMHIKTAKYTIKFASLLLVIDYCSLLLLLL